MPECAEGNPLKIHSVSPKTTKDFFQPLWSVEKSSTLKRKVIQVFVSDASQKNLHGDDGVDGGDDGDDGDDGDPFKIVTDGNTGWLCRCCRGAFPHRILLLTVSPAC